MLDQKLYALATELLQLLSWDDLRSLTRTVTDGIIVPINPNEAILAIIQHSKNAEELLSRQKVTREVLYTYLHKKNVTFSQNDKPTLKQIVLKCWLASNTQCQIDRPIGTSESHQRLQSQSHPQITSASIESSSGASVVSGYTNSESTLTLVNPSELGVNANELALRFTEWFYSLLNKSTSEPEGCLLGPEHFYEDSSIRMTLDSSSGNVNKEVQNNASDVAKLLVSTKSEHGLHFNPNISPKGVRGKMDSHGLVLVAVCGTLHQGQRCVGVFEQLFGLAKDPFAANNWKIKYTEVNLKSQDLVNTETLSLENSDVGRRLLALPDKCS